MCALSNSIHVNVFMTGAFSDNPRLVQLTSHLPSMKIRQVGMRAQLLTVVDIMEELVALIFVYP